MSRSPAQPYPPDEHMLRDLRLWIERDGGDPRVGLDVVPEMLGDGGGLGAGVLGTLIDVAAGELAVRAARPGWVATSDLVYHLLEPVAAGRVEARPSLVRRTRTTLVIEVEVDASGVRAGLGTLTFALLEAKGPVQRMGIGAEAARTDFALEHSRLRVPFAEAIGARAVDEDEGVFDLPMSAYVVNSLGALQGGAAAALLERAAAAAARAVTGAPCTSLDLAINYLSLGRVGPIRSRARLLRREPAGALLRVELRDTGADDRLLSLATIRAAVPGSGPGRPSPRA